MDDAFLQNHIGINGGFAGHENAIARFCLLIKLETLVIADCLFPTVVIPGNGLGVLFPDGDGSPDRSTAAM